MNQYLKRSFFGLILGILLEIVAFGSLTINNGIQINDVQTAISRIVAIILIFDLGTFLFNIQKMPDYHLNQKEK